MRRPNENAILYEEQARKAYEEAKKMRILTTYTFPESPCADGYFYIKVKDESRRNGRKTLKAKTLSELQEKVLQHENTSHSKTFYQVYAELQDYIVMGITDETRRVKSNNTVRRHWQSYNKYIKDSKIAQMPIVSITPKDVSDVCFLAASQHKIRRHEWGALRTIVKQTFDHARFLGVLSPNEKTAYELADFRPVYNALEKDISPIDRGYTDEEIQKLRAVIAEKHQKKPDYLPTYGLELQILLGLRRGEVAALQWSDFDMEQGAVTIQREQLTIQGTKPLRYHMDDSTKTSKKRRLAITPKVRELLSTIMDIQRRTNRLSVFLFPAETEIGCITNTVIPQHFDELCKKAGIFVSRNLTRGTHAFRRNFESDLYSVSESKDIAADMTGNTKTVFDSNYSMGMSVEKMMQLQIAAGR